MPQASCPPRLLRTLHAFCWSPLRRGVVTLLAILPPSPLPGSIRSARMAGPRGLPPRAPGLDERRPFNMKRRLVVLVLPLLVASLAGPGSLFGALNVPEIHKVRGDIDTRRGTVTPTPAAVTAAQ